jgi:S-adenosylmethionine decarboxylase proenzyme
MQDFLLGVFFVLLLLLAYSAMAVPPPGGKHLIVEYNDCNPEKLNSLQQVDNALQEAARLGRFNIVTSGYKVFKPQGITYYLLLSESHISIHTWPESSYAAVDIFTCGKGDLTPLARVIGKRLECEHVENLLIERGDGIVIQQEERTNNDEIRSGSYHSTRLQSDERREERRGSVLPWAIHRKRIGSL